LRLVAWALGERGGAARGSEVARLVDELRAGRGGNLGGVLASVEDGDWVFRPEPPRRA
jgi:tRNA(Ile)-lysidine synthase